MRRPKQNSMKAVSVKLAIPCCCFCTTELNRTEISCGTEHSLILLNPKSIKISIHDCQNGSTLQNFNWATKLLILNFKFFVEKIFPFKFGPVSGFSFMSGFPHFHFPSCR